MYCVKYSIEREGRDREREWRGNGAGVCRLFCYIPQVIILLPSLTHHKHTADRLIHTLIHTHTPRCNVV